MKEKEILRLQNKIEKIEKESGKLRAKLEDKEKTTNDKPATTKVEEK